MSSSDEVDGWSAAWPTTLDWTFDFHKLLEGKVDGRPCIGTFEGTPPKVAIIGAGVAGLMTARELLRAGCETVHLYEATDRIGGRTWSIPAPGQRTCYEMGAMRIPFFHTGDDAVHETPRITTSSNCVLASLCKEYGIQTVDFPMPGGPGVVTGTYLNDGFGVSPNAVEPEMLVLKKRRENEGGALEKKKGSESDAAIIQKIDRVWTDFASHFKAFAGEKYKMYAQRPEAWRTYWKSVVEHYHAKDFRDLVFAENITSRDTVDGVTGMFDAEQSRQRFELGDFGGLGLNNDLATVFYTVGAGDGGWGAFYDISSLYVIRILLAGYGSHQQLVVGLQHPPEIALSCDSEGRVLPTPRFLGIQSFAESLYYLPIGPGQLSMHQRAMNRTDGFQLFVCEPVEKVEAGGLNGGGPLKVTTKHHPAREYDAVVLTTPTWATQMNLDLRFPPNAVSTKVMHSMRSSHWINSCKVFFPLKRRFWDGSGFPSVVLTDTFIQDVYIYAADKNDPGVLLASYTWEDNAMKMLGFDSDAILAQSCLRKLDEIFERSKITDTDDKPIRISDYVDPRHEPIVVQWAKKPSYAGCAKLYRRNNESENNDLLTFNREHKACRLYFAGEAYSLEGGWIEPAMRTALDAVLHIIHDHGGMLAQGLDIRDYERLTDTSYLTGMNLPRRGE